MSFRIPENKEKIGTAGEYEMRLGFPGKQLGEIKGGGNGRGSDPTTRGIYKLAGNPLLPILHICFRQF
jgi:hypothetical protein